MGCSFLSCALKALGSVQEVWFPLAFPESSGVQEVPEASLWVDGVGCAGTRPLSSLILHFLCVSVLHLLSLKEGFLLLNRFDSQEPRSSVLLCESAI